MEKENLEDFKGMNKGIRNLGNGGGKSKNSIISKNYVRESDKLVVEKKKIQFFPLLIFEIYECNQK